MLTRGKAVVETLLVVDRKGRGLFGIERRQPLPFAPGLFQWHAAAHDLGYGYPGPDFVEEPLAEAHRLVALCPFPKGSTPAFARLRGFPGHPQLTGSAVF